LLTQGKQHRFYRRHEAAIKRIVVDECHQILTSVHYRECFEKVKELASYPVQKIYLTATLPPQLEHELKVATCLPESVPVIRESTDRPNLAYHVLQYNGLAVRTTDTAVKLAKVLQQTFEADSRGIIFCRSIARVEDIAPSFGHCKDHSKMSSEHRMAQFERWRCGSENWMVATTGLLHGIDYGWVDAIIFVEMPYGLMNFAQGAGRAGRKGRPSNIFLLHSSEQGQILPQGCQTDETCLVGGVQYMLNTTECRRFVVTNIMDGQGIRCGEVFNALPCDICAPDSELAVKSKGLVVEGSRRPQQVNKEMSLNLSSCSSPALTLGRRPAAPRESNPSLGGKDVTLNATSIRHSPSGLTFDRQQAEVWQVARDGHVHQGAKPIEQQKEGRKVSMSILMDTHYAWNQTLALAEKVKILARVTEVVKGHCPVCWAWKKRLRPKTTDHKLFSGCADAGEHVGYVYGWLDFKKEIRKKLPKYQYCYNCGLPQGKLLPSSHPAFEQGSTVTACPLNDFGALVLWHIFHHEETWEAACRGISEIGTIKTLGEFQVWVSQKTGQDRFWNGLELILWFMGQRENGLM
jgi:Helicase conserved C-terminal domain